MLAGAGWRAYKHGMPLDLDHALITRWSNPDPGHGPVLREAGIEAVVLEQASAEFSRVCGAGGIQTLLAEDLQFLPRKTLGSARSNKLVVLAEGSRPGVSRGPAVEGRGDETASASRDPWIDINSYWVAYLKALYPERPAVLGYTAALGDRIVPFDSLELALIEARAAGGNYILSVE